MDKRIYEVIDLLVRAKFMRDYTDNALSWEADMFLDNTIDMLRGTAVILDNKGFNESFAVGDQIEHKSGKICFLWKAFDVDSFGSGYWYTKENLEDENEKPVGYQSHDFGKIIKLSQARFYSERLYGMIDALYYTNPRPDYYEKHYNWVIEYYYSNFAFAEERGFIKMDKDYPYAMRYDNILEIVKLTEQGKIIYQYWKEKYHAEEE